MEMIRDALMPERLEEFKKLMEREDKPTPEVVANKLDAAIRQKRDIDAEMEDRIAFLRRKMDALTAVKP